MAETIVTGNKNEKVGEVVSIKMTKTIVVQVTNRSSHPVYKRIVTKRKKFYAHDEKETAKKVRTPLKGTRRIAVISRKGGVGKTTTTINLACLLAKMNLSVLVWDLDPQGGTSYFFNKAHSNNNNFGKFFGNYIPIYDVIKPADTSHIDIISNDTSFSDQFINSASPLIKLEFLNNGLFKNKLDEVSDDYDVVIIDCPPGKFTMHDNVFTAADLLLIPNIPAPLSVYCNNMLVVSLGKIKNLKAKIFSFYNMVQARKTLHKMYLANAVTDVGQLQNHVPFYTEIETISHNKSSIFHQLKDSKSMVYYENLWDEICEKMDWDSFRVYRGKVVDLILPTSTNFDCTIA